MGLQLRPGLHRVWRRPGRLQIGLDPSHGTVLDGLTAGDERLLAALAGGTTPARLAALAARLGIAESRARALVHELGACGALAGPRTSASRLARIPDHLRLRLAPDATTLGIAHPDGDGWQVIAARRAWCVAVVGAGRTGLAVALGVATAGVGCVLVEDDGPVTSGDVLPGGYSEDDVGRTRSRAARDALARSCPETRTSVRGRVRPDLVVLVSHGAIDPARADTLVREDLAHLAVLWGERSVAVGPLVVPGSSCCLRCQHLHRTDRDPEWPRVVAQLTTPGPGQPAPAEEVSMAGLAAGLAVGQVLAHLDAGAVPATLDAAFEAVIPGGSVALRAWPPHPSCGCRWPLWVATQGEAVTMVR